jgi:hypothetical protein
MHKRFGVDGKYYNTFEEVLENCPSHVIDFELGILVWRDDFEQHAKNLKVLERRAEAEAAEAEMAEAEMAQVYRNEYEWENNLKMSRREKDKIVLGGTPVDPAHYQGFIKDMQWLEAMMHIYRKEPDRVQGFLEITARKYKDRAIAGKEGTPLLQDFRKGLWYTKALVAFINNDRKPFAIADMERLSGRS